MRIGYIPCKDGREARRLAGLLLGRRLIACANLIPTTSLYEWNGKIARDKEVVLLIKTTASAWKEAQALVEEEHSYECPCIIGVDVEANTAFATWASSCVGKRGKVRQ